MALTLTQQSRTIMGNKRAVVYTATLDSSYPTGGEALTAANLGLVSVDFLLAESKNGYMFEYDYTNSKLKAYYPSGTPTFTGTAKTEHLIVEETVTVSTNVGTLANVPFYVCSIEATAGGTTGLVNIIPTGETPLTKQCAATLTDGTLTFVAADAVTEAKVTYIPLQTSGPFVEANRVVDESVTAAAAKTELANRAAAIQYVWDDTDGVICTFEPVGEAPSATHKCVVDITNGTPTTDIDSHADDEANTLKVTYVKYSALPAACCIGDEDISLTSEAYDFTAVGGYMGTVIPGLGTQLCGEEADTTNATATIQGPGATAANVLAKWEPTKNYLLTNNTAAMVTFSMPFFVIDSAQMAGLTSVGTNAGEAGDEVTNLTNLSSVSGVRIFAYG